MHGGAMGAELCRCRASQQLLGADNLGWAGTGPNACEASDQSEGNCGTNDPMRICGTTLDAYGNHCNWTGCALDAMTPASPNQYFGGCSGNYTAGTLCCLSAAPTTPCAPKVTVAQSFALGVSGCAGSVGWADRNTLCAAGCQACTSAQWLSYNSSAGRLKSAPTYDYWTNDLLTRSGTATSCAADNNGTGTSCGSTTLADGTVSADPMRICVSTGPTDPLGNHCTWNNCGLNTPPTPGSRGTTGDYDFGGCNGDSSAGTLCCCDN